MTEDPTAPTKRRGPGRPFSSGHDPRRHTGGTRPNPATFALRQAIAEAPDELVDMWRVGIARARAGDVHWASLIAAYSDGKPVARQEQGGPGAFARPDFSDLTTDELREYIKVLRGGKDREPEEG